MDITELLRFTQVKHVVYTVINILLLVFIYHKGNIFYKQTGNPKALILGVASFSIIIFQILHLFYSLLSEAAGAKFEYTATYYMYQSFSMLVFSISGICSALYHPNMKDFDGQKFKRNLYLVYSIFALVVVGSIEVTQVFFPLEFQLYAGKFVAYNPSFEIISNALYILAAFIYADILKMNGKSVFSFLPVGFFILGIGTIYLLNAEYLVSDYRSLVHIARDFGFLLIFLGIDSLPPFVGVFSYRQKILAYPALMLVLFSLTFFLICVVAYGVQLPEKSHYLFLILYIVTLCVAYGFSSTVTKPITEVISYVDKISPEEEPPAIENKYNDEIGILIHKIQKSAINNWEFLSSIKRKKQRIQKLIEKEVLLRNVIQEIRSSLDLDKTLDVICEEVANVFNVERTVICTFKAIEGIEEFKVRKEYLKSPEIKSFGLLPNLTQIKDYWKNKLIKSNSQLLAIDNLEDFDAPDYFKDAYEYLGVKSVVVALIKRDEHIWGTIGLSSLENFHTWTDDEKDLLLTIADQIYIAVRQAEVYEKEKQLAERERINRNIIEILRSSIDKTVIKKLFVKNIGKFFNADRVLFADYDEEADMYLPVDDTSEYRTNTSIKSLVGVDWGDLSVRDCIAPLIARREVRIVDWEEFVAQTPSYEDCYKKLYKNSNILSTYSFPVLYEFELLGFFSIEFSEAKYLELEDIARIRSICTQAGIALYHAEMYERAKNCVSKKDCDCTEIIDEIVDPANNILEKSLSLTENEYEREVQLEYLKGIIRSCNILLELTQKKSK